MTASSDKLRGSVISQVDLLTPVGESEWEMLGEAPRYTLKELLAQCDANASEMEAVSEWQRMKPTGREQ
ncbi:PbsX family transcriptional regulator [Halomonas sp. QX-2]|jgi:antitoxin ChpS|uniref:PbsX family transcriptional regulator n=1 Tax=Vreelandella sedimenti TaxID=2729618 RepID=A0A7Z0N7D6_9GAMM|nr:MULTISPECIES: PbsX family transcriptional regulator [Halomonas]NYT72783.1 PbsX family transcriptional regulator [Halomonas sedimenti]|tara:strand:- start:3416 stop:3622 length:207 start_codon:yes stop_codon:yes gene_type:complete